MKNKHLILFIVLLISSYFLFQAFKDIHVEEVIRIFKTTQLKYVLVWFAIFLIVTAVRTFRWKYFLNDKDISILELFHSLNIGNFASLILPFRAGEFIRPLVLSRSTSINFTHALLSIVIERVADVLGMFFIFYLFVKDVGSMPQILVSSANGLAIISSLILLGLIVARFYPKIILSLVRLGTKITKFPESFSNSIFKLAQNITDGLSVIKSLKQLFIILSSTVFIWFCYAAGFAIILPALDKTFDLTIGAVVAVFVALAIAAPNTPGFLLTFEMGVSAALAVFAYLGEFSLAFALLAHTNQIIGTILLGLFSLWSKGLSLKQIKSM